MNIFDKAIISLKVSNRIKRALLRAGIETLGQLTKKNVAELWETSADRGAIRGIGRKSINELTRVLAEMNLHFGMDEADMCAYYQKHKARVLPVVHRNKQ